MQVRSAVQFLLHLRQASPFLPHLSRVLPGSHVLPEQQPEQELGVQRHVPSTHSWPGPQGLLPPHLHCPPSQRSTFIPLQEGLLPQTQTPRGSHALARAGSHVTQAMPPEPQVLKDGEVHRPP